MNIGILYDNISGNTGDVAIGLSLRKMMQNINVDFDELVPGNYNPLLYDSIVIGGGHLLREGQDFFYDKFKVKGKNILNSMGVVGFPKDLDYLNEYKYLSFRSSGDKEKAYYLKKESNIVPCTTMLLDDIKCDTIKLKDNCIGIHLIPDLFNAEDEQLFLSWVSALPYTIYFIPITHYNHDYTYMGKLCSKLDNAFMLPIMKPLEIFTLIGKLKYFISCSLHGSIFSYIHNVPFILMNQEKSKYFLEDRNLEKNLFNNLSDIINLSDKLLNNPSDYSSLILKDKNTLSEHVMKIEDCIGKNYISVSKDTANKKSGNESGINFQINSLQTAVIVLQSKFNEISCKLDKTQTKLKEYEVNIDKFQIKLEESQSKILQLTSENNNLIDQINYVNNSLYAEQQKNVILEDEKNKILQSRSWKLCKLIYNFLKPFRNMKNIFEIKRN